MKVVLLLMLGALFFVDSANGLPEVLTLINGVKIGIEQIVTDVFLGRCMVSKALSFMKKLIFSGYPDTSAVTLDIFYGSQRVPLNLATAGQTIIQNSLFNQNLPTVIFIHGFTGSSTGVIAKGVVANFLQIGGYNVLAVNANSLLGWDYFLSIASVPTIGKMLGKALSDMYLGVAKNGVTLKPVYIVGISLGAHIAGYAGRTFTTNTKKTISRITGLDPAGPCYFHDAPSQMLQPTDADFVDVIHTNMGVFGIKKDLGHVSFYPNGGKEQPNLLNPFDSHMRAGALYIESILNTNSFPAVQCDGWHKFRYGRCNSSPISYMGFATPSSARGKFFLNTNKASPYSMGMAGASVKPPFNVFTMILGWLKGLTG